RPRELRADRHPDPMPHWRERSRIDHLAHEAAGERAAHPSREREAVDDRRAVLVEHRDQIVAHARRMDRTVLVGLLVLLANLRLESGAGLRDFFGPFGAPVLREVELELLDPVDELAQHQLRIADDRHVDADLPSDSRGRRVDLDIFGLIGPGRRLAEMLAAPEAETDREHHVGAAGERLLERAANREWMLLRDCALARAAGVDRNRRQLDELADLRAGLRPEQAVPAGDQRTLRGVQQLDRAIDVRRIAGRADIIGGEAPRALALPLLAV